MSRRSALAKARERYESIGYSISRHTGTPYPCESADLRELRDPYGLLPYLGPRAPLADTARLLESKRGRAPRHEARSALQRLRRLHDISQSGEWYADLPFKIFGDIDVALFDGELSTMIHMRWVTDDMAPDMAHLIAWTCSPQYHSHPSWGGERICISLNARALLVQHTMEHLVGTLTHECTVRIPPLSKGSNPSFEHRRLTPWWMSIQHAYLQLHCGMGDDPGNEHGPNFVRACEAVGRTLVEYAGFEVDSCAGMDELANKGRRS